MLNLSDRNLKEIASNPSSPPSLLTELSNHCDLEIRSLVASNPNTPLDILMQLGEEFPDEILENSVINLLMIEDPDSRFIDLCLARSTKTDPEILAKLAATEKEDRIICCAVARNINTPIDALKSLVGWRARGDEDKYYVEDVTTEVINNPNMPISYLEESFERLINIGWDRYTIMNIFSKLSNLSIGLIESIIEQCGVTLELFTRPLVQHSPDLLDKVARRSSDKHILIKIIENPVTLNSTIEYMATHCCPTIRNVLIERPNVSQKALDIVLFRQGKPGTPIDLLNELAEDFKCCNLESLTQYPYTPAEILEKIANSQYRTVHCHLGYLSIEYQYALDIGHICNNLARHPNTSFELLERILNKLAQKIATYGYREHKDTFCMVKNRLSKQYVVPLKTEAEPQTIGYRYSRENLFEFIPEYKDDIPF